jgi:uncharacterized membrane protein
VKPSSWFGIIVLFTVLTILIAYFVSSDSPLIIFRYLFGFLFVAIMPGYCLVSVLFPNGNKLDFVEEAVLSVALSFGIAGIAGLFLGLSGFFAFSPIIVSLSGIVLVLALFAFIRKRSYEKTGVMTASSVKP